MSYPAEKAIALATYRILTGFTPEMIADILAPADEDVCAWLDGSCTEAPLEGDIWCAGHKPRLACGSHPRMVSGGAR